MHFTTENEELLLMIVEKFEGDELLRFNSLLIDEVEKHKTEQLNLCGGGTSLPSKETVCLEARKYACKNNDINHYNVLEKRAFEIGFDFARMHVELNKKISLNLQYGTNNTTKS